VVGEVGEENTAMGIKQVSELSAGLMLLVDGAFVQRRLYRLHGVNLKETAEMLIRGHEI
jgi:hypothetical protein